MGDKEEFNRTKKHEINGQKGDNNRHEQGVREREEREGKEEGIETGKCMIPLYRQCEHGDLNNVQCDRRGKE
jgi:hypothetical protein